MISRARAKQHVETTRCCKSGGESGGVTMRLKFIFPTVLLLLLPLSNHYSNLMRQYDTEQLTGTSHNNKFAVEPSFTAPGSPETIGVTDCPCYRPRREDSSAQAGQDFYVFDTIFLPQGGLCCEGVFVEFGARNGISDSNTYLFERFLGWKGLLFEVDSMMEKNQLSRNRPNSNVVLGPVCPSYLDNVTILLSTIPGHTGATESYEPSRSSQNSTRNIQTFKCYHLAKELESRKMRHIDYMTIDTEGSELDIIKDFPWNDFDVRVVQIEQLVAEVFPSQQGRKEAIKAHLESFGYKLLEELAVDPPLKTTIDLIFTRNLPQLLQMKKEDANTIETL